MKKTNLLMLGLMCLLMTVLSSCAVIGGVFKAGIAVGIICILAVVLLLIWLISLFRGRS